MRCILTLSLATTVCLSLAGCPMPAAPDTGGTTGTTDGTGTDGTGGTGTGGPGTDTSSALGFDGSLSGSVSTSISSSESGGSDVVSARLRPLVIRESAQDTPPSGSATVWFTDLDGNPLTDANGDPYPPTELDANGDFTMVGLPVGVDFVVHVDYDGDGEAELKHIISIPQDEDGSGGSIEGVNVNPLTTMAYAKLISVIEAKGISAADLDFSPAAVIDQLINAFLSLFALMGIDSTFTIDQILSQTLDSLAAAFDALVPDSVKASIDMATSNIDVSGAASAEELVLAVIPILLNAGIAVADQPGGVVLDELANLPNVKVVTWEELWGPPPEGFESEGIAPVALPPEENRIFLSTVVEVDRNFAMQQDEIKDYGPGFIIHKHALERMAGMEFAGKTLSLANIHSLATDLETGMGMRLTYSVPMSPPDPDLPFEDQGYFMTFQSADQRGVEVDVFALEEEINSIWNNGYSTQSQLDAQEAAIRAAIINALGATVPPSPAKLFGGIVSSEQKITIERLAHRIRNSRSHIPFNWSGPQQMYVLSDRDRWRNDGAKAVTVSIEFDANGQPATVTYVADGTGKYLLNIWGDPEFGFTVEFMVAATGRTIFDKSGFPFWADPTDSSVFAPVQHPISGASVSFLSAFSETGENWPIEPVLEVSNPWFDPTQDPDPETNPQTVTIGVLVNEPGPTGQAVLFDLASDNTVSANDAGNYALELYWENDVWYGVPIDTRTGQRASEDASNDNSPELAIPMDQIVGLLGPEVFTYFFDIDVANPMHDPQGDPWYDDINGNDVWDIGEPTFDWREELWSAGDWRSTNVERYYRRADNNLAVRERDVNWDATSPQTWTGVALIARDFKRRLNAFTFGRPNSAINLLTAFLGHDFFDGTHNLDANTRVGAFGAMALLNLVFDARLYNLEAYVADYDFDGVKPARLQVVEAWPWNPPIDDPIVLIIKGFEDLAAAPE